MSTLTEHQVAMFEHAGYLVVDDLQGLPAVLASVTQEYTEVLNRLVCALRKQGRISSTYSRLPFAERLAAVRRETGDTYSQHFNVSLPPDGVNEDTPYWTGPAVFAMLCHEPLLDVVESVLGPEITVTPILHVRVKPPEIPGATRPELASTPPHQDASGVPPEADATRMLTVWIPQSDASEQNGCLRVWPGSHRNGILPHNVTPGRTATRSHVVDEFDEALAVPVRAGSLLLMHRHLLHASLPNHSSTPRWSFDLRYQPTGQPSVRAFYPSFVARSRSNPQLEMRDPIKWAADWKAAKQRAIAQGTPQFQRF